MKHPFTELSRRRFLAAGIGAAGAARYAFPQMRGELAGLSLKEASDRIRSKKVSPVDLTEACLDSIKTWNPKINAWITVMREKALEQAPAVSGNIDGKPFAWIADADTRLGPLLEAIVLGKYYWIPFSHVRGIVIEKPAEDILSTIAADRLQHNKAQSASGVFGITMTNSSPPMRADESDARVPILRTSPSNRSA